MPASPIQVHDEIRAAYLRYFDTAFWLRDETMMAERRRLLAEPGLIFTDLLLEPVVPYEGATDLAAVCATAGLDKGVAPLIGAALFGPLPAGGVHELREHQSQALAHSLQPGLSEARNPVVTSGTGSGKTESFLLPILARLVQESRHWP